MDDVRTVQLGQFTDEHAEQIAAEFEAAGITWWSKRSGRWGRTLFLGDWGTRLQVDERRLKDARAIARRVLDDPGGGQGRP